MHTASVAIFGASGYAGRELTSMLASHPFATVEVAASDRHAGSSVEEITGLAGAIGRVRYVSTDEAMKKAAACSAAFLATPAETSLGLAPRLCEQGSFVVDLSGAFRLRSAEAFTRAYGLPAAPSGWLEKSVYGLPELTRAEVAGAAIVANPGCYPTAVALALGPLLRAGVLDPADIVVDAMSGVTGAGRKSDEAFGFVALHADARAYKVLTHQHTPEIEQVLARFAGEPVSITFTPHLVPIARGILSTAYGRLRMPATSGELRQILAIAYHGEQFVKVVAAPDLVSLRGVVGTNDCLVGVACDPRVGGRVVVVSAIDNLVKGAAGQAIQNLNLKFGWEESAGLVQLRRTLH